MNCLRSVLTLCFRVSTVSKSHKELGRVLNVCVFASTRYTVLVACEALLAGGMQRTVADFHSLVASRSIN
jgi:hypothetical protein